MDIIGGKLTFGRFAQYLELEFADGDVLFVTCDDWGRWKVDADGILSNGELRERIERFREHTEKEISIRGERIRAKEGVT